MKPRSKRAIDDHHDLSEWAYARWTITSNENPNQWKCLHPQPISFHPTNNQFKQIINSKQILQSRVANGGAPDIQILNTGQFKKSQHTRKMIEHQKTKHRTSKMYHDVNSAKKRKPNTSRAKHTQKIVDEKHRTANANKNGSNRSEEFQTHTHPPHTHTANRWNTRWTDENKNEQQFKLQLNPSINLHQQ